MSHTTHKLFEAYALIAIAALVLLGFSYYRDFRSASTPPDLSSSSHAYATPAQLAADTMLALPKRCTLPTLSADARAQ